MPYDIYAIRAGEFWSTQYYAPFMCWKYNPTTDVWDWLVVDAPGFDWSGIIPMLPEAAYFEGHNADGDIGRQQEGPIEMGGRLMIPAFLMADLTDNADNSDTYFGWMYWDRSVSPHGEVRFGPHSGENHASYFPMIFSVVEDPNNAGQYYVSGGYSMVAHWDGTSATFTNWDESDLTKYWNNMRSQTLPSLHGQAEIAQIDPAPSYPYFDQVLSTYMFRWDGRFYFVPYDAARLNFQVGGVYSNMRAMLLYSHDADNLTPDTNADLKLVKAFYLEDPASWLSDGNLITQNYRGLKPIYYDGHWWLHSRHRSHASGGPLGANHQVDLTFAWVLDGSSGAETFYDAVEMSWRPADPYFESRAESLGLYLHQDTNTLYALYCSTFDPYSQPNLHILRLDDYDLGTSTFNWTEVATVPNYPEWSNGIPFAATITSDDTHLFVQFTDNDNRMYRINPSDGSYTSWRDETYEEWGNNQLIMRFGSPVVVPWSFGTIIGL